MIVVAVASQKGGAGKTTLAGHLAVEAENAGFGPVTLIDTDPQGSLSQWWNTRAARAPQFAKVGAFELQSALSHLARTGTKIAFIDTPPAISDSISHVIAHCDLVVVPTRPSPHDLRAVGATVDMAERFGKPLIFVVNGATLRARITGEAAVALSQHGVVAPVILHHRVDFAASMVDGRTVGEAAPKSASAKEITDLWLYIQDRLARITTDANLAMEARRAQLQQEANQLDGETTPIEMALVSTPPANVSKFPPGDRRDGPERRVRNTPFAGPERRVNVFGRRNAEQQHQDVASRK
jgi:chromosome partitioning protein